MDNANNIFERKNLDGSVDYVLNMGSFLYNDKIVSLSNIVIPIRQQTFFILPNERKYYAVVNVYYSVDDGIFVFDTVKKSPSYIEYCDSDALTNVVPVGQFVIQQSLTRFEVKKINLFSKMSTFSITTNFVMGDRGAQGDIGDTGFYGNTGFQGYTGFESLQGYTGIQGETCVGSMGYTGIQGATGIYHDFDLQLHLKFKNDDINVIDYSAFERDFTWGATGAGLTGLVLDTETGLSTIIEIIDQGQSTFEVQEGVVDNCHSVHYNGGTSGYRYNQHIGFTGTIHCWVNVNQPPVADFIYETMTGMVGYPVRFMDASLYAPDSLTWDINGLAYNGGIIQHSFGSTGAYMVRLTASNFAGSHTKSELITIV